MPILSSQDRELHKEAECDLPHQAESWYKKTDIAELGTLPIPASPTAYTTKWVKWRNTLKKSRSKQSWLFETGVMGV